MALTNEELVAKAKKLRKDTIELIYQRKQGHSGGAMSIIDVLTYIFGNVLTKDDKFILSKGHCCVPYFLLLREKGFNPTIMGHPEIDEKNGIHCTTGSLGHGFPQGVGMALAKKKKGENGNIYVLLSDAECQEGTTWESLLIGAQHKLDNIVMIVDNNHKQTLGSTDDILSLGNLQEKLKAFNWDAESIDGHSFDEIRKAFSKPFSGKPRAIVSESIKGKGISFMEQDYSGWHNAVPSEEQLKIAQKELA